MSFETLAASQRRNSLLPNVPVANVLGVGVHAVDLASAAGLIRSAIETKRKGYICVTGVHGIMEAHRDAEFRRVLASAMLVVPDGMPTVWIGHRQGHLHMQRVFGPDLMLEVCQQSVDGGLTHFLYGGKPGIADELAAVLRLRFPGIRVLGTYTPPFRRLTWLEESQVQEQLDQLSPDIVWVGLSTPKQEKFMAENIGRIRCKLMVGVGAAFDLHTGRLNDAPQWVKNAGLQWLHRLAQEPSRLWKRYLVNNSAFVVKAGMQALGIRTYDIDY